MGNSGPSTAKPLRSLHNLANLYMEVGRHGDALTLGEQGCELKKKLLGLGHPDTLASMGMLAVCYRGVGRHEDALPLPRRPWTQQGYIWEQGAGRHSV